MFCFLDKMFYVRLNRIKILCVLSSYVDKNMCFSISFEKFGDGFKTLNRVGILFVVNMKNLV